MAEGISKNLLRERISLGVFFRVFINYLGFVDEF